MINPPVFNALCRRIAIALSYWTVQRCSLRDPYLLDFLFFTLVRKKNTMDDQSEFTWGNLSHPVSFKLTGNWRINKIKMKELSKNAASNLIVTVMPKTTQFL
jgi:hypothetical protein